MYDSYEFLGIALCLIGSGFFAGAEATLLSIGIDRTRQLISEGGARGKAMEFMAGNTNELLTTILVGNNIANILAASLATSIATRYFEDGAIGISVGLTTILILIFGEIMPKTFARNHAETLVTPIIKFLQINYYLLYPVIRFTTWMIKIVLGDNARLNGRMITKDDIEYMINKAEKEKTMDSKQIDMLNSIMEFPKIKVKDIMISRAKVKYILASSSLNELLNNISEESHSRYPVVDTDLETTMGFLHIKDLAFVKQAERKEFDIKKYVKSPFFVYEHMKIQSVFDHMNRKKVHLALVKDENGLVVGIITLEDIIEEVFGEIQDEHDDEELLVAETEKKYSLENGILVTGDTSIRDLDNEYEIKIPLNDNYSTIAGFILDMLGNEFPEKGQKIFWEGLSFELERVEEYGIREIRIKDVDGEKHFFSKSDNNEEEKDESNASNSQGMDKFSVS
jgi:putative hemolysin